jgi:hypothetical protein
MTARRIAVAGLALGVLLTGCSSVVDGSGTLGRASAPSAGPSANLPSSAGGPTLSGPVATPSAPISPPGSGSSAAGAITPCPHVEYPYANLSYDCITTGLARISGDKIWPLLQIKTVEPATHWVLEEGAGRWGPAGGKTLGAIAQQVRTQMVDGGSYLTAPKVTTVSDKDVTINGVAAHVLQTTMTLNPAAAKKDGTKVREERLWIVTVSVGSGDVSVWHTSIPDLARSYWAAVPALIDTIRVI